MRSRRKEGDRDVLIATMTVAYKFLRESFTTRVTLDRASFLIRAEYVDGPFSHLENVWRFEPHGRGDCIIRFSIDYEFKSRLLQMLIGSLFERVFARSDVNRTSGNTAKGSWRLSTTWLNTSSFAVPLSP